MSISINVVSERIDARLSAPMTVQPRLHTSLVLAQPFKLMTSGGTTRVSKRHSHTRAMNALQYGVPTTERRFSDSVARAETPKSLNLMPPLLVIRMLLPCETKDRRGGRMYLDVTMEDVTRVQIV